MEPATDRPARAEQWFLLVDPAWEPASADDSPPVEAVVGVWPVEPDGGLGKFRANPDHVPSDADGPTDPLDAVLRLAMLGEAGAEHVQLMLRDTLFDIALEVDGRPVVTESPDGVPCVVVATGEPHRRRFDSPDWRQVDLDELVVMLADGVDVLFNPDGPAAVRLTGDFIRQSMMMEDERATELYAAHQTASDLRLTPWGGDDHSGPDTAAEAEPGR
ncbi:type VII secretion system-associated protein [Actinosynnema sp. NPDC053489]|uniref:type VII secretion system-associated protein n=1 Tax=Actinosynnema sp. NPDC053489 TaxID=3363916 RepID=UPI0037C870CD